MPRALGMLVFGLVATALSSLMHWYVYVRLVRDSRLPGRWPQALGMGLVVLAVSMPLSMFLGRTLPPSVLRVVSWPVFTWMGMLLWLVLSAAALDLLRVLLQGAGRALGPGDLLDPARRVLLQQAAAGAVASTVTAMTVAGLRTARDGPVVKEVAVELARLPAGLDGLTLAQITDVHVGLTVGRDYVEDVVNRVNQLQPHAVVITGDLVDGSVDQLRELVAPLKDLVARHGVFFVTGNHEYYSGVEEWMGELERLGIRVLHNERVSLETAAGSLDLAGVDDFSSARMAEGHGPDLEKALRGRDPHRELVLLAHQPRAVEEAARHGVGLQLSGHTHGGQIWPWGHFVALQQRWVEGLFQEGGTQLYVSPGTGYWGPPLRLGTRSEITRVTLRAPQRLA